MSSITKVDPKLVVFQADVTRFKLRGFFLNTILEVFFIPILKGIEKNQCESVIGLPSWRREDQPNVEKLD